MRILLLSQFHAPVIGGEERHVISLSESLAARGHEVTVGTLAHPDRPPVVVEKGVTVRSLGGTMQRFSGLFSDVERRHAPPFPDPELGYRMAELVRETRPDVVHAHNWIVHSYLPVKRFSDAPLVMTLHDYGLACAKKTYMRDGALCEGPSFRRCMPCASAHYGKTVGVVTATGNFASSALERRTVDRFVAVSHAVARYCRLVGERVPYDVLPTFILDDVGTLGDDPGGRAALLPESGYLLYVGDLNRNKGVQVLLDAYVKLADAPPLVMIGRRCDDMPTDIPAGVAVHESWPHASVMHAWSRCLFGIAPSVWPEACGTIVMEANAVGRPMIASDIGGLSELVVHGETGLHVPPGDAAALASAMALMIADPDARERMARAAKVRAETFMAKTIVPRIERVYDEAIRARAPARSPMTEART